VSKRYSFSLKATLVASILIMAAGPLLLLQLVIFPRTERIIQEEVISLSKGKLKQGSQYLSSKMSESETLLEYLISQLDLSQGRLKTEENYHFYSELLPFLHLINETTGETYEFNWSQKEFIPVTFLKEQKPIKDNIIDLLRGRPGRFLWMGTNHLVPHSEQTFWLHTFLDKETEWILCAGLNPEILRSFITGLELTKDTQVLLISPDNRIFPESQKDFLNKPYGPSALNRSREGNFISYTTQDLLIYTYMDLEFYYNIVALSPLEKITESFPQVRTFTIAVLVVLSLILLIPGLLLVAVINRRLTGIVETLNLVSMGNFKVRIKERPVSIKEFHQLSEHINALTEVLGENVNAMAESKNRLELRVFQQSEELNIARSLLLQSEKMADLGRLVASFTHEVNNSIGISVTAASFLKEQSQKINAYFDQGNLSKQDFTRFLKESEEAMELILKNLRHSTNITGSFKHIATDQTNTRIRNFDLSQYIEEIIQSLSPRLKHTRHKIEKDITPNIYLTSDPSNFYQILSNLLGNSLIHGFIPEKAGIISIKLSQENDQILLKYGDNGKGVPQEIQEEIFEPFFTTKGESEGTGLGLAIIKEITEERLHGRIEFKSAPDNGFNLTLIIPLKGG